MNNNLPPLNEKLISCVLHHIEHDRKHYKQNLWVNLQGTREDEWCGTKACFAGWTILLSTPTSEWQHTSQSYETARKKLGLTDGEARYLFNVATGSSLVNTWIIKHRLDMIRLRRSLRRPM